MSLPQQWPVSDLAAAREELRVKPLWPARWCRHALRNEDQSLQLAVNDCWLMSLLHFQCPGTCRSFSLGLCLWRLLLAVPALEFAAANA